MEGGYGKSSKYPPDPLDFIALFDAIHDTFVRLVNMLIPHINHILIFNNLEGVCDELADATAGEIELVGGLKGVTLLVPKDA